jgi:TetR/AcrR family transcriptional repressor of nem operon
MPKPSHREKLLQVGMQVVHERGYRGASVRDIVQAAGVPQGSFTNHFASKEAFGLEVVERYAAQAEAAMAQTLRNAHLPPLQRLHAFIERSRTGFADDGLRNGCLLGNFSAEANDCGEALRRRVVAALDAMQDAIASCLRAAVSAGELVPSTDCDGTAGFILAALQGATLLAKARRDPRPLAHFEDALFERVLRRATPVR